MKNKQLHRDLPWKPTCRVGDKFPVQLCDMEDDTREKYSAKKATAAILRAMRK